MLWAELHQKHRNVKIILTDRFLNDRAHECVEFLILIGRKALIMEIYGNEMDMKSPHDLCLIIKKETEVI